MRYLGFILTILFITGFLSCGNQKSPEELMSDEINRKVKEFIQMKKVNCGRYIIEEAAKYVDSIMYMEIGNTMSDSMQLPERPERPDTQEYLIELDTTGPIQIPIDTLSENGTVEEDQE